MATSAPGLQPSVASSSQTSSSDKKTSAEWKRYFEVLLERKKAADNGKYWCEEELQSFEDVMPVLRKRFLKKCYHPAMAAAFLMDPVFWKKDPSGDMYTPDKNMIDKMDACLEIDVWKDARKVIVMTVQNACMMLARWLLC